VGNQLKKGICYEYVYRSHGRSGINSNIYYMLFGWCFLSCYGSMERQQEETYKEVITLSNPKSGYDPYEDGYDDEQAEEIKAWEESGDRFRRDMSDDDDDD